MARRCFTHDQIFSTGSLSQLRLLNLNGNSISSLPPQISLLQSLEQLSLSNNLLTQLPTEIGGLAELQELHVDGNRLTTLPPALGDLRKLRKLLLHKNQIRYLPSVSQRMKGSAFQKWFQVKILLYLKLKTITPEISTLTHFE